MARVVTVQDKKLQQLLAAGQAAGGGGGGVSKAALLKHAAGLVGLMERFSLLHSIDDSTAIVPPLLPQASPATGVALLYEECGRTPSGRSWRWWHAQYAYSYLPDALLCRALCRLFFLAHVEVLEAWRFGAVLRRNGHIACLMQGDALSGPAVGGRNTLLVTVCGARPDVLGILVSAKVKELLAEAFTGVQLQDIYYGCASCVSAAQMQPGLVSVRRCAKAATVRCEACDAELHAEVMALRDDQAQALLAPEPGTEQPAAAVVANGSVLLRLLELVSEQQDVLTTLSAQAALDSRMVGMQGALGGQLRDLTAGQAEAQADVVQRVLALHKGVALLDAKPMPALHVLLPEPAARRAWWKVDVKGLVKARFRLHLLCEHPDGPHLTDHEGYEIERPKQWLRKYVPAVRIISHTVGLLLGAGVKAHTTGAHDGGLGKLGAMVDEHVLNEPLEAFKNMNLLLDELEAGQEGAGVKGGKAAGMPPSAPPPGTTADWHAKHAVEFEGCQEARREIQLLIKKQDPNCRYGDLQKVAALSGDILWLCKRHAECHAGAFKIN
ncbi:hypothetical protein TSOC_012138 [Tetrabaena socialis]|uniref:C-terminal of Roc COR-B domain-containing protein n=1 Tax=Tetrabaena socialis TaxID=47790 RepID=A0A2J7ZNT0_9CHLO|nr:hypothetical protein TSOC_012138 [Tetrabaena socialis]|eukprot:PNH01922.1 hypothetical protein TSOC_012138 [Tetrabaena socialis]